MDVAAMFADIAIGVSAAFGGPFHPARVITHPAVQHDDGGSIVPGSDTPALRTCTVQVDSATQAMRQADGYVDGDAAFYVLAATLAGGMDTDAQVDVLSGPHAGLWMVSAIERDPCGAYWLGRGRKD